MNERHISHHFQVPEVYIRIRTLVLSYLVRTGSTHSFTLDEFLVDTGSLKPRGGSKTVEFVANKAGIFQFSCGLPHVDEETGEHTGDCDPDHERMTGNIIVLDR